LKRKEKQKSQYRKHVENILYLSLNINEAKGRQGHVRK
jgi:hypothetical protein